MEDHLRKEVENVHAFIAAWFRGETAEDHTTFQQGLAGRMAKDLINIQPSGAVLSRSDLLDPLFGAHGANPDFNISIRDFRLLSRSSDGNSAAALYVEDQAGARNTTPSNNSRITTVLFDISGNEPVWLHLHETAVP